MPLLIWVAGVYPTGTIQLTVGRGDDYIYYQKTVSVDEWR